MKLFTKADDKKLFAQYAKGSDMKNQNVVVKIFNPYGNGTWFIMNSDPEDPDYLWGIADLGYGAEVGSISRSELENYKNRFGLGLEKDSGFSPINALEVYQGLRQGEYFEDGGFLDSDVRNWGDVENFAFQMLRHAHKRGMITTEQYMSENAWQTALEHSEDIYDDDLDEIGTSDMGHYVRSLAEEINESNFANGGEIAKAEILRLRKNIMGTTSIEMKISGMRKPQDFIVYPISANDTDQIIKIQSSTRIGKIDLKTGRGVMSQSHSSGAYSMHFQIDKLTPFSLKESDLEELKMQIFKTAGSNVGTRGVVTDNSGASRIMANGGGIGFIPMDLEEKLAITAKWGGTDVKGVIGILNAMIDSGLTDEDLKPKPAKSSNAREKAIEQKTMEIWTKIEPNYKGDLIGNRPISTIRRLVTRSIGFEDNVLSRYAPYRENQKDSFKDGGFIDSDIENWGDIENFAFQMLRQAHRRGMITTEQYMSENAWQIALEYSEEIYEDYLEIGTSDMGYYLSILSKKINESNFANGGETEGFKSGDKVTDGRGNIGIVKSVQSNGLLYIQWVSYSGEPTRDITADNNPEDFEKLDYANGGEVGNTITFDFEYIQGQKMRQTGKILNKKGDYYNVLVTSNGDMKGMTTDVHKSLVISNDYANGGQTKRKIHIVNDGEEFDKKKYKAVFDDFDKDGTSNIDDANPLDKSKQGTVEPVELKHTFAKLLSLKNDLDDTMHDAIDVLDKKAPKGADIYARTKTPYSILKKLVDKRLLDPDKGLTDLIGTTIAVDTQKELEDVRDKIDNGLLGKVLDRDDYYKTPKAGYRAVHYIVEYNGIPVEVQLKTKNQKKLNEVSHEFYKKGTLNAKGLDETSKLVEMADRGDKKALTEVNKLFKDKELLASKISNEMASGGATDEPQYEAIYNRKKVKITASSLWQAKTKAIQELKVPKSKVGYLAVYNINDPIALMYESGGKTQEPKTYLVEITEKELQKDGGKVSKRMTEVVSMSSSDAEQLAKEKWQEQFWDSDLTLVSAKTLKTLDEWIGVFKKNNAQRLAVTFAENKNVATRELQMQRGFLKIDNSWDLISVEKVSKPKK